MQEELKKMGDTGKIIVDEEWLSVSEQKIIPLPPSAVAPTFPQGRLRTHRCPGKGIVDGKRTIGSKGTCRVQ
jgi:hypothetical protein